MHEEHPRPWVQATAFVRGRGRDCTDNRVSE
jgi:hypothetical protein